jgi:hypothetical protein
MWNVEFRFHWSLHENTNRWNTNIGVALGTFRHQEDLQKSGTDHNGKNGCFGENARNGAYHSPNPGSARVSKLKQSKGN